MRILVAGWHGQIALSLSEAAARRGDVTAYAVGRPALDLADSPSLGRTLFNMKPDVVINSAAYTQVDGAEREPDVAYRWNTKGAAALAAEAHRLDVPIIHLSSVYVFDGTKTGAYTETDAPNPLSVYGTTKRDGEKAVMAATPHHIILRTGWVFSPFGRNFVTTMLTRGATETALHVDTAQRGSPTYAPHLANAILDIAARLVAAPESPRDAIPWGTYHIANRGTATWLDIASEAFRRSGKLNEVALSAKQVMSSDQAPRPRNATLDSSKIANAFGVEVPYWQDAVADCVGRFADG